MFFGGFWLFLRLAWFATSGVRAQILWQQHDFCQFESFNVTCPSGSVLLLNGARYGRMGRSHCISDDYELGCYGDVLAPMDSRCSGRHSCNVPVPDKQLHLLNPCPRDLGVYMSLRYTCLPVVERRPCGVGGRVVLNTPEGYISGGGAVGGSASSSFCDLRIQMAVGQRINLSLYDFASQRSTSSSAATAVACRLYARLRERDTPEVSVCGGGSNALRVRQVYTTTSNVLDVIFPRTRSDDVRYILRYKAVGCPDLVAPPGGWIQRSANTEVTIGCNATSARWHLVCSSNGWAGTHGSCPHRDPQSTSWGAVVMAGTSVPFGLLLSVSLGVIFGVIIGSCMLFVVVQCKRRRHDRLRRTQSTLLAYNSVQQQQGATLARSQHGERKSAHSVDQLYDAAHDRRTIVAGARQQHIYEVADTPPTVRRSDRHRDDSIMYHELESNANMSLSRV